MKIMVIDTQGPNGFTQAYRDLLPGVRIRGRELASVAGQACTPHGAWCGWLAAAPRAATGVQTELVFVRCFDGQNRWIQDCEPWLLDTIEAEQPDYVSRSWGAWDGDDALQRQFAMAGFERFTAGYSELLADDDGPADFGAAGNNDRNDADDDVAFPQAQLSLCNVTGACDRRGVPCVWSGDGRGVLCVMWGDRVLSPDAKGIWTLWSGTSAATPKACGAAAALELTTDGWREWVRNNATRPKDWKGALPHPKWGWGCEEESWQLPMKRYAPIREIAARMRNIEPTVRDYRLLPGRAA